MSEPSHEPLPFAGRCLLAGACLMLLGVICGAFGTHLLEARLTPTQLAHYQTAVLYHLLHALGLLLMGLIAQAGGESRWLRGAAGLMVAGVICFSGSIYLITAGAPRALAMVVPLGGVSLMAAWALLAEHARRQLLSRSGAT